MIGHWDAQKNDGHDAMLKGVAAELDYVLAHARQLEATLTGHAMASSLNSSMIEGLQTMDVLIQSVEELRAFLAKMASACNPAHLDAALSDIGLEDLKLRLSAAMRTPSTVLKPPEARHGFVEYL